MTTTASTLSVITDGNTFSVVVRGVALFTDAGLTVPVVFPQSVSADVTWYAAALTRPGVRQIEVLVTASNGTSVPVPTVQGLPATVDCAEGVVDYSGPASSGGSGTVRLVEATVHFDTANILTGAAIYTPTPGDWIPPGYYNFSVSVPVAFNGTTPLLTLGAIVGGVFVALTPVAGTAADHADAGEPGIPDFIDPGGGSLTVSDVSALLFNGVTPLAIKLDDGAGGDPGSTAGTAKIVFLVATPTPA